MIQLHFDIKQLKIDATIRILQLLLIAKYMNMKGFREPATFYKCHVLMHAQLNELFVKLFTLLIQ